MDFISKVVFKIKTVIFFLLSKVRFSTRLTYKGNATLFHGATIILEKGLEAVNIGQNFVLEKNSTVKVTRYANLEIGDDCFINHNASIVAMKRIHIGNRVIMGPNVAIYDHDHLYDFDRGVQHNEFRTDDIVIGNNVWIGAGCIILKGSIISDNAVIGAGSVIKGSVPPNSIVVQKRVQIVKVKDNGR